MSAAETTETAFEQFDNDQFANALGCCYGATEQGNGFTPGMS